MSPRLAFKIRSRSSTSRKIKAFALVEIDAAGSGNVETAAPSLSVAGVWKRKSRSGPAKLRIGLHENRKDYCRHLLPSSPVWLRGGPQEGGAEGRAKEGGRAAEW